MSRAPATLLARALVPCALVAAGLAAAPGQAAAATDGPRGVARQVRGGVATPATTPASLIDVVVPLHVAAGARAGVAALAHSELPAAVRRERVRSLAPSTSQGLAVSRWARAHGFTVTDTTPWTVSLRGRASSLAAAFGTTLAPVSHRGRGFVAPRSRPAVPAALRGVADAVLGLDTRPVWAARTVYGGGDIQVLNRTPVRGKNAGAGATVATVNLSGWHPGDLTTYRRAAFGSGDVAPPVTNVVVSGGHVAATVLETDSGDEVEVALDAETIAGVAPAAAQRMYFAGNSTAGYIAILNKMASDLASTAAFTTASASWGTCEANVAPADLNAMRSAITTITALGATFFAASGDSGAFGCGGDGAVVDFPASAEDAVAVGGTTVGGSAPTYTSSAWSGSGGGCSSRVPAPTRQLGLSACAGRAVPDIATIADPGTGAWVYDRIDGWIAVGGTSLAAPAAAAGLAGAQAHGGLAKLTGSFLDKAYDNPSAFTDVTTGDNGLYRATAGYDLVTGLGSPVWTAVEAALTGNAAPAPVGHNEPLLAVNASPDRFAADLLVQVGASAFENGFAANGEPVTGYAASASGSTTCASAGPAPPGSVSLPAPTDGTVQLSLSVATTDPDVPTGCITVQRPLLVDTVKPVVPVPVASYVGTSTPAYRFSWGAAGGAVLYAVFVTDITADKDVATFVTSGRAFPYPTGAPFKAVAGHRYVLEVDAADVAWNIGYRTASFVAPYDDSRASVSKHLSGSTYVSDWTRSKASADYLGSHLGSSRKGAYYAFSFTGKTLTAGVLKSRYGGYADVYVDGVRKARVSLYRSSTAYRQAMRLATFTTAGTHRVVVKVVGAHQSGALGNYVFLDSLSVT